MSDSSQGMTNGWLVEMRHGQSSGTQMGPYSWDRLVEFAGEKRIAPEDLVWHPSMTDWAQARTVPGLFSHAAAPQPTAQQPVAQPPAPSKKPGCTIAVVVLLVVLLGALAAGGFWLFGRDSGGGDTGDLTGGTGLDLGTSEVTLPADESLIQTAEWGEVPADQIGITLLDGFDRSAAEAVATSLDGSIVGEIEFISAYQIQFPGASETDLIAAIDSAAGAEGVESAFPNQQTELDTEIWGVPVSSFDDPVYGSGAGDGYKAVGVDRAWKFIDGAGVELSDVHVGIVDNGLYREGEGKMSEFGGDVKIDFPDADAGELDSRKTHGDGTPNAAGSHGTGVATIIGADPDNGGTSGIAGPLGSKLQISMINQYSGNYGNATSTPDPNDPTKIVWGNGRTYALGSLVALNKQIESGATIINCSWGNANAAPQLAAAYKKYFEKMAQDHPDVLFVCSGGNTGTALDGSRRLPSGLALPNMITVGAVDNDGKLAEYSSKSSDNYEVTLAAPGTDAVVGQQEDGSAERQDGTSFSAPHVAAAAAILRSIDPGLSAGDIKRILVETARPGITVGETSNIAPEEVGGGVLAIDQAVLKVINDKRAQSDLPPLTEEMLEKMGSIDAVAITGAPGEYTVKGIIEAAGENGTDIKIEVSADGSAIGGSTTQSLSGAGEVEWRLTLPDDIGVVTVTRLDSGASSVITIDKIDINGAWNGSYTITDLTFADPQAAEEQGCTAELMAALIGTPFPMTMDITVDEAGNGSAVSLIDMSSLSDGYGDVESEPQTHQVSYTGSTVTFTGSNGAPMTATVSRQGQNLVMNGSMSGSTEEYSMTAVFTLTKPAE